MKSFVIRFTVAIFALSFLSAGEDPWKGEEYAKNSASQQSSAQDFIHGIHLKGATAVLDVGCGDGKVTAAIARALPHAEVVGVDISPSMIDFAQKTFSQVANLHFQVRDAAKIEFQEKFDLITSFTVMQWVLEQRQALEGFQKALKPGGRLCIQMPTGLPKAMEQALHQTLSSNLWKPYFTNFSAPWKFYSLSEYHDLLGSASFSVTTAHTVTKHERFPSRAAFHGFLKQWFPHLRPLPNELKDAFLTDLLDNYLRLLPADEQGQVSFIVTRLEVEAIK